MIYAKFYVTCMHNKIRDINFVGCTCILVWGMRHCRYSKTCVSFDLILYVPVNNFSVMLGRVFLGSTSTKQGLMCLAQGHNTVPPVRLEPATPQSRDKHSTL